MLVLWDDAHEIWVHVIARFRRVKSSREGERALPYSNHYPRGRLYTHVHPQKMASLVDLEATVGVTLVPFLLLTIGTVPIGLGQDQSRWFPEKWRCCWAPSTGQKDAKLRISLGPES